jgi:hypothetical protein
MGMEFPDNRRQTDNSYWALGRGSEFFVALLDRECPRAA